MVEAKRKKTILLHPGEKIRNQGKGRVKIIPQICLCVMVGASLHCDFPAGEERTGNPFSSLLVA